MFTFGSCHAPCSRRLYEQRNQCVGHVQESHDLSCCSSSSHLLCCDQATFRLVTMGCSASTPAPNQPLGTTGRKKALIVCTSANKMGDHDTGLWSEECTGPYYVFKDAGCDVTVCSIGGGDITIDAGSVNETFKTENDKRMETDGNVAFKNTPKLGDQDVTSYDIVFFSGGHGTCVDFPTDAVGAAVSKAVAAGKVVAAVCHGPMALVNAKTATGEPVVKGKKVACFTDKEEDGMRS